MKTPICPECDSSNVYFRRKLECSEGDPYPRLLYRLGPKGLMSARMKIRVCGDCGYIRLYASKKARVRLAESKHWKRYT